MAHITVIILALSVLLGIVSIVLMIQRERPALRPLGAITLVLVLAAIGAVLLLA